MSHGQIDQTQQQQERQQDKIQTNSLVGDVTNLMHVANNERAEFSADIGIGSVVGTSMTPAKTNRDDDDQIRTASRRKRRKIIPNERLFLSNLPSSTQYAQSLLHRAPVSHITVAARPAVVYTASTDGTLKCWKHDVDSFDLLRQFRPHSSSINELVTSPDEKLVAVSSKGDKALAVFDNDTFDQTITLELDFVPGKVCWVRTPQDSASLLAVADADSPRVDILDPYAAATAAIFSYADIHSAPLTSLAYNPKYNCVISADEKGNIEYWQVNASHTRPAEVFRTKSSTDLYEFRKAKSHVVTVAISPKSEHFATLSKPDRQICLFAFKSGKLIRKYDESLSFAEDLHAKRKAPIELEDLEFGRRLVRERTLDAEGHHSAESLLFDESGLFLIYPSIFGIKVVNTYSNVCVKVYGASERMRFSNLALYQGAPRQGAITSIDRALSANALLQKASERKPILVASAVDSARFCLFSNAEPGNDRDEKQAEHGLAHITDGPNTTSLDSAAVAKSRPLGAAFATLHTSLGDIRLEFYSEKAPKAVENFVTLVERGYYDGTIFHRVIPGFMIQAGDPEGDGTGGQSCWGGYFEDELDSSLCHDAPFMLSMANAGPDTNGSQFFITTASAKHLDGKHTIFGRATAGTDVIKAIEAVRTDKRDRPLQEIQIRSTSLHR
ncbi:Peptidyl-prolyl cis-trans isomerase cyp15 [Savitreella phatthalungensis]